jgi:hypothetical protein
VAVIQTVDTISNLKGLGILVGPCVGNGSLFGRSFGR